MRVCGWGCVGVRARVGLRECQPVDKAEYVEHGGHLWVVVSRVGMLACACVGGGCVGARARVGVRERQPVDKGEYVEHGGHLWVVVSQVGVRGCACAGGGAWVRVRGWGCASVNL